MDLPFAKDDENTLRVHKVTVSDYRRIRKGLPGHIQAQSRAAALGTPGADPSGQANQGV
ncbi:hypothetical protein [Nonomuraea bangladeshensis]|uniref:hypothetical protein n=1 Tax=Nonomuraea bangladeshensis TaxID=404385 RepID=UPI003F4E4052